MLTDLSTEAKQSFQVVALLATVLVVGIHYKSDIPEFADPGQATWNQLGQEFLFGGVARVAVPLFAFAAGLFYFRSDDGSLASYRRKLSQRIRSVAVPYVIISSFAAAVWLAHGRLRGDRTELGAVELVSRWLLHPPAEQLWFLRDLMCLIVVAPLIRRLCDYRISRPLFLMGLLTLWAANVQLFPMVAGWHLIQMETLLFFTLGCAATSYPHWIEGLGRVSGTTVLFTVTGWWMLIVTRITVKADFDMWYVSNYGAADLMLHQTSILVGCIAVYMIAFRSRHPSLLRLSGASFFVYLVHEFPLRAAVDRIADRWLDHDTSCWLVTPLVLVGCFTAALWLSRHVPAVVGILTGGRIPSPAATTIRPATVNATHASA